MSGELSGAPFPTAAGRRQVTRLDRGLGGFLILLGVGIAVTAHGYTVGFMVDPLGPRALPYLVSGLFLLSGGALLLRRATAGKQHQESASTDSLALQATCTGVLLLFALAIPVLGFVPATTLATGAMARLFGGRWIPGLGVGLAFGLALLALFTLGFGMDLPPGLLFGGSL